MEFYGVLFVVCNWLGFNVVWRVVVLFFLIIWGSFNFVYGVVGFGMWIVGGMVNFGLGVLGFNGFEWWGDEGLLVLFGIVEVEEFLWNFEYEYGDFYFDF